MLICTFISWRIPMRFLDLFSGIGGFRLALERAGHTCIGYVENNAPARKSYEAIFNTKGEWTRHDIREVEDREWEELKGKVDLICGGFPCQPFSITGKREGFEDSRGNLFFEIARVARITKAKFLLLENVKHLLHHENGETFKNILKALDELGYNAEWQVLNSKDFGVPHSRERIFIIGYRRGECSGQIFPISREVGELPKQKRGATKPATYVIYDRGYYKTRNVDLKLKEYCDTLTCGGSPPNIVRGGKLRRVTPRECWRLQGFPDWAYNEAAEVVREYQLYIQAGNTITVNVVERIGKELKLLELN